jgi:DNA polymerase III subunit gamma/tau
MAGDVPSPAPADPARRGVSTAPTALYRRYRPATFAELKGQDHVTEPLRQALRSGRVHHAYLFSGPRGCGKTSSARILARSLNCEQGPTPDPCGTCASCIALAPSGPGSIDVIEIDAASHGGVDDARDLRERAFYAPVAGRFKIYIVDEAHMVTREGFNALLKLVEEPPPHLKFVFATTEPEKVIPTIRSRTHHYPFRLMPPAVLRGLLEEILENEGVRYEPAVLPVVIRAGAGSARDALSVLDQLLAGSGDAGLTYERAVALLGYTDDSLLDEVCEAFAAGDGAAVFHAVDRVVEAGHDPRRFAADLLDRLRDLIVLVAVPDAVTTGLLDVPADRLERMREQASAFGQERLARAAQTINAGLVEMRGATSPRLQLELICAQVLLPAAPVLAAPAGGGEELLARLERLERRLASGDPGAGTAAAAPSAETPVRTPPPAAPRAAKPGPARDDAPSRAAAPRAGTGTPDADSLRERWPEILEAVKRERRVAWILLSNAAVDTYQDGILTLRFAREGEARGFSGSDYDKDLGQVLESMLGIRPKIRAVSGGAQGGRGGAGTGVSGAGGVGTGTAGGAGVVTGVSGAGGVGTGTAGGAGVGAAAGPDPGVGATGGSGRGGASARSGAAGGSRTGGSGAPSGSGVQGLQAGQDEAGGGALVSGAGRNTVGAGQGTAGAGRGTAGAGRGTAGAGRGTAGGGRGIAGAGGGIAGAGGGSAGAGRGGADGPLTAGGRAGDVPAGAAGDVPGGAHGADATPGRADAGGVRARGGPVGRGGGNPSGPARLGAEDWAIADDGASVQALSGMDLIQHTLGGEIIGEIDDA